MAGINDRDRLGSAGGAPTRYTINRSRSSSKANPTQIDILKIDDSEARKTLEDFYKAAKDGAKSTSSEIRRMWNLSSNYSDDYRKEAIDNIDKISKELDKRYDKEVERINRIIDTEKRRDALTDARRKYNLEQIKLMKQENSVQNQALSLERERSKLKAKYGNTKIGRQIQQAEELRIKIDNEYARANNENLTPHELFEIADHTDELEGQLAEANKNIERSIDASDKRADGIKSAIKGFLKDAITILTHNYIEGVQGYFNSYESTFTEFAGRLGTDYDQTRQFYSNIISETFSNSMNEASNISKEMIPAVQNALQKGFKDNDAIAKAIADEQSRILMPWLDTQSDAWVNMSFNMSKQNMNLLKSQQLQLQTSKEGNRLLQSGVINSMTSEMEPLLRNIDLNTGGVNNLSVEGQAMMASLVKQGMSAQDAYALVLNAVNVQKDVYGALTSGDVTKVLMGQAAAEGKGLFGQFENVSGLYGFASTGDNLSASALNDILNLNMVAGTPEIAREIFDAIKDKGSFINISDKDWEDVVKGVNERLTETKQQENVQQNDTARVGEWITAIPQGDKWFSAIIELGEGILAAIIAGFGGNVLAKALGLKAGNSFLGKLLGGGGGSAVSDVASSGGSWLSKVLRSPVAKAAAGVGTFIWAMSPNNPLFAQSGNSEEGSIVDKNSIYWNSDGTLSQAAIDEGYGMVDGVLYDPTSYSKYLNNQKYSSNLPELNPEQRQYFEDLYDFRRSEYRPNKSHARYSDYGIDPEVYEYYSNLINNDLTILGYNKNGNKATTYGSGIYSGGDLPASFFNTEGYGSLTDDQSRSITNYNENYRKGTASYDDIIKAFNGDPDALHEFWDLWFRFADEYENWEDGVPIDDDRMKIFLEELGYRLDRRSGYKLQSDYIREAVDILNSGYGIVFSNQEDQDRYDDAKAFIKRINSEYPRGDYAYITDQLDYPIDSYAIGSPYITKDKLAFVHEGERILTQGQNEAFGEIGSTGLLLAGSTLINKLLGFSNLNTDDDISREDMTDTLVESLDRVTAAISGLAQNNGIDYSNRTLPRITNNYNSNLVNLVPSISTSK